MTLVSRAFGRLMRLHPPETERIHVERNLRVPMPDGVVLLADRYAPRGTTGLPVVLMRCPYGRRSLWSLIARLFAERGYQTVLQSVRGTFGSGGVFEPFRHEAADGRATLDWLAAQPWSGDSVAMFGPSYLGFTQWSVAADAPGFLKAIAPQVTASEFRDSLYPGNTFGLDVALTWIHQVQHQEQPLPALLAAAVLSRRTLARAFARMPLCEADTVAVGHSVAFYQDWLVHDAPDDAYWAAIDNSRRLADVTIPVNMVAGWYDIFLPYQLADYAALRRAGRQPRLTIGPWTHLDLGPSGVLGIGLREALAWFDVHLRGAPGPRGARVRVFVMGARQWVDLPDWPPPGHAVRWYLQPGGGLADTPPPESRPSRFTYNPAQPTPSVGGGVLGMHAGARDNRPLEARPDVLTYTTPQLESFMQVMGPVSAELVFASSLAYTDIYARLCVVERTGRSVNLCEGIMRLSPEECPPAADGVRRVNLGLGQTAYRFAPGQRLRLQLSSGAHPRFSRNPGTGEPLASAQRLELAHQTVYHDPAHLSAVVLNVTSR